MWKQIVLLGCCVRLVVRGMSAPFMARRKVEVEVSSNESVYGIVANSDGFENVEKE